MITINEHALKVLDFERIRREVAGWAYSDESRRLLHKEGFLSQKEDWRKRRDEIAFLLSCLQENPDIPDISLPDLSDILRHLEKPGAPLDKDELSALQIFIHSSENIRRYLHKAEEARAALKNLLEDWPELREEARLIAHFIEAGEWKEECPELRSFYRRIDEARNDLRRTARSYLQTGGNSSPWQEDIFTDRDGRTVLPLKSSHRGRVEGIIHGSSATGSTLYVEPPRLVEKNNALFQFQQELHQEQLKILRMLTSKVRERLYDITSLRERILQWDCLNARARYGLIHQGQLIEAGDTIILKGARHPLLKEAAVPINIVYPPEGRIVLVSGPNTGGKTVALKTLGLLALMNQFNLPLPVHPDSQLPLFQEVFTDVGDEQSIDTSLSTFSSHMVNIGGILEKASSRTLILLDELGSGTAPEEGGPLAMAIMDRLVESRAPVFVTSHHGLLKHYGFTRNTVVNASVEFDEETLSSTYQILMGVPGDSRALVVAERSGIPGDVIRKAREYRRDEASDLSEIIKELTQARREALLKTRRLEEEERDFQREKERLAKERDELIRQERRLREEGLADLRSQNRESRRILEGLIRELREKGQLSEAETTPFVGRIREFRKRNDDREEAEEERLEELREKVARPVEFKEGEEVLVGNLRKRGTLLHRGRNKGWLVQVGPLRMEVPQEDLEALSGNARKAAAPPKKLWSQVEEPGDDQFSWEEDVRGCRLEEALERVNRHIDQALLRDMVSLSIIHGKGSGILQRGIHELLRERPEVARFDFSAPERGGAGRTEITLRE